jgi:hypothetical protein
MKILIENMVSTKQTLNFSRTVSSFEVEIQVVTDDETLVCYVPVEKTLEGLDEMLNFLDENLSSQELHIPFLQVLEEEHVIYLDTHAYTLTDDQVKSLVVCNGYNMIELSI